MRGFFDKKENSDTKRGNLLKICKNQKSEYNQAKFILLKITMIWPLKSLLFSAICCVFFIGIGTFARLDLGTQAPLKILTQQHNAVIQDMGDNAMRWGAYDAIHSDDNQHVIGNLIDAKNEITDQATATQKTLNLIKRLINFALGLVSLVALIILIFAGVKMVTAAGDDKAFGAGKAALTKVTKAILGIAVSWLIISGIFWLINEIAK